MTAKAPLNWLSKTLFLAVLLAGLAGCMHLSDTKPPGPWYEAYQPIDDPASDTFVAHALEKAVEQFGAPAVPVNKVMLRRSKKVAEARGYRIGEDFSLTECVDSTNGVFVIYLAVDPGHPNYFPLLGHECIHLLNPFIIDWYMEGIATLFSEQYCEETGREWGDWKRHFMRTRREPYALSYRMMLELQQALPDAYPALIRFTAENGKGPDKRRIDIDAWLATLSEVQRDAALDIISAYADVLRKQVSAQYYFTVPAALE
ncbi:MAG: hypothetical protein K9M54_03865 [Kiritimatiellales bacterium]|nr:hypothetical protein [Kiritimatiellales bacterium]